MNNNTRSIFTDIRYTSKYHQDLVSPARPPTKRSISDSAAPFVLPQTSDRIPPIPKSSTSAAFPRITKSVDDGWDPLSITQAENHHGAQTLRSPVASRKRSTGPAADTRARAGPSRKRRRRDEQSTLGRTFSRGGFHAPSHLASLPSPLFFSNSPAQRPQLPPRFSSSEAGAKMLSNAQGEERNVKTVTLARGSLASAVSPTTPSRPLGGSRYPSEHNSFSRTTSRSPDSLERHELTMLLDDIGLEELLEHDPRPSFIVDLADPKNFHSNDLHIFHANTAFRDKSRHMASALPNTAQPAELKNLFENMSALKVWMYGRGQAESTSTKHVQPLADGGMLWSCTFLRRRVCVVSGTCVADSAASNLLQTQSPQRWSADKLVSPSEQGECPSSTEAERDESSDQEPMDYFGLGTSETQAEPNAVMPSIEDAHPDLSSGQSGALKLSNRLRNPEFSLTDRYPAEQVLSAASAGNFDTVYCGSSRKEVGFFDWTRLPMTDDLPAHIRFARSIDWSQTPLGPIETWSADLRQMCNLIMASPHPAAMYWGDELVAIYNEAYVVLAGQKHPALMGQSYREAWAEIWDEVKDVFASAQTTGQATMKDDDCLFIRRNFTLEETYFSWSIIPMVGEDGSVMGLYNPAFEKTRRKIAERRMLTLREIGERTATARDVKSFWEEVLAALECNEFDTPFVLLYSMHGDGDYLDDSSVHSSNATGFSGQKTCSLEGALGVPLGHSAAPVQADLNGDEGYVSIFREVQRTNKPVYLELAAKNISPTLLEGLEVRGFNDPVQAVVVCPIHPTTGESTLGFLVLGVNPRRPYDDDYQLFVQLLGRQLATSLASVVLFEEEIKRGQQAAKLAALDRIELSEQLAARTQEAIDSETKFSRMAEFVPVGVFIGSCDGVITYCNESWFSITHVPPTDIDKWMNYVKTEDKGAVDKLWYDLTVNKQSVSAEFRFQSMWTDRNNVKGDMWVLFSAYPERNVDGSLKSVFGSITNISSQKWAEGLQKRKMEEAVELKRQQENFIDITSHEMRNPLSAILQCADEIVTSLGEKKKATEIYTDKLLYENAIDAAHTIVLCAQHQKRIVDDILTLSKLDSALLMVTPVDVQPVMVAQRALKMFEGEVQSADISMQFKVDRSIQELDIDWCKFDPSRVLQVLINLTTNAIKFTTSEKNRAISITLAVSQSKFSALPNPVVQYFPARAKKYNSDVGAEWGEGEEIYIQFAVQDTGRGLSTEEKKMLFNRFAQASPRTHVQYGGSGLGLFISRELTELQGGEIGVASEAGQGSTFAFFIRAKKTSPPTKSAEKTVGTTARAPPGSSSPGHSLARRRGEDSSRKPTPTSTEARQGGPLKVLIVEDNLVNQKVLQKQLRNMGCETHVANHGGEALDRLRASWFAAERRKDAIALDVVLMDQEMPVMDGLTCTKKIRELEAKGEFARHVPVIAVTANARVEQIQTAKEAGMDDVVSKPFRIQELIPKMEELTVRYAADGSERS